MCYVLQIKSVFTQSLITLSKSCEVLILQMSNLHLRKFKGFSQTAQLVIDRDGLCSQVLINDVTSFLWKRSYIKVKF
jgi:hypothetical protein